jgi:hypothetical protein
VLAVIERGTNMLKKLFIATAAAAAVAVPLAGAAWADPADPSGNGVGEGGIPQKTAAWGDAVAAANPGLPPLNPNGSEPLPPGQFYKNIARLPGSTPEAAAGVVNSIYGAYTIPDLPGSPAQTSIAAVPPGMATKTFTPACATGHTVTDPAINGGAPACH